MSYSLSLMLGGGSLTFDPDARAYIAAVEAADGQALEPAIRTAYDTFIRGCKSDGIWDAIKASCILSGARSLSGALVPLVGSAPTNNNFVSGDYVRTTGLVGDGTTKYLNSNRNNDADPQDSKHLAIYATTRSTTVSRAYLGAINAEGALGSAQIVSLQSGGSLVARLNDITSKTSTGALHDGNGLFASSRENSSNYTLRGNGANETITTASASPLSNNIFVFARNLDGVVNLYSNARLAFYSIGEALDLASLDARLTTLLADITAALP